MTAAPQRNVSHTGGNRGCDTVGMLRRNERRLGLSHVPGGGENLPVASTSVSQHEWDAFGRHGMATTPKDRILIQLAYALDSFTPRGRNRLDESGHPRSDPRPLSHGWPEAVRGGLQPHLRDGPDLPHLKPPLGRRAAHGHF